MKRLFSLPDLPDNLIFKGGTSLSKAYGIIERFSEDIDLSLDLHDLGFTGDKHPANAALSGRRRKTLIKDLSSAVEAEVACGLKDKLSEAIAGETE